MEHSELIDGGTVVPGNPNASELYKRLLGPTENGVQMPFGQEPLPAQSIEVVRQLDPWRRTRLDGITHDNPPPFHHPPRSTYKHRVASQFPLVV